MVLLILLSTGAGPFPGIFPSGGVITPGVEKWSLEGILDQLWHLVPAGAHADPGLPRGVRPGHAVLAGRRAAPGLPDHRARQGDEGEAGAPPARRPQRPAADDHAGLPQHRLHRRRARSRSRRCSPGPASACCPTRRSADRTCRCCRPSSCSSRWPWSSPTWWPTSWSQPSTPGSAHEQHRAAASSPCLRAPSGGRGAGRRLAAVLDRIPGQRAGLAGLGILAVFVVLALAAPLLFSEDELDVTEGDRRGAGATDPGLPARHRRVRPLGARPRRLGRPGVAARRHLRHRDLDGHRHPGRHRVRALRRLGGRRPGAAHRLVPRHPVPAAGHRAGHGPRVVAAQHHRRDRRDVVAGHGPAGAGPDPGRRGPAVPRARPGARRRALAPDDAARAAQRHAAGARQHHPDRGDRDPVRDHAVVPRAR